MRVMFGYLPLAPVTRTREPLGMTVSDMFLPAVFECWRKNL